MAIDMSSAMGEIMVSAFKQENDGFQREGVKWLAESTAQKTEERIDRAIARVKSIGQDLADAKKNKADAMTIKHLGLCMEAATNRLAKLQ
jgi:hypothetical protein